MENIKNNYLKKNIFAYIPKEKVFEFIKYNKKLKQFLEISNYNYQKLFIQNHFIVDLSKFQISNLINYFQTKYNNFSGVNDDIMLKKIISETPWFNDYKKEKIISKKSVYYAKCINLAYFNNLINLSKGILYKIKILDIIVDNNGIEKSYIKNIFPSLIKLKLSKGIDSLDEFLVNIQYDLLKNIQILSLNSLTIKIIDLDNQKKDIELPSLKKLKLTNIIFQNKETILIPNLEYLYIFNDEQKINYINYINDIFSNNISEFDKAENLDKIFLKFPKLKYCDLIFYSKLGEFNKIDHKEITIRKFDKGLITYEYKNYIVHESYFSYNYGLKNIKPKNSKDPSKNSVQNYYKKLFFTKKDKNLEKKVLENYEEIITDLKNDKIKNFLFTKINENYNNLQSLEIVIDKNNVVDKNILIENLKYFLFLRKFVLFDDFKFIADKKELINIINNLSKLSLIENIKIEILNKYDLNKTEEKEIFDCIKEIKGIVLHNYDNTIKIEYIKK